MISVKDFEAATKLYAERFDNVDELRHPALLEVDGYLEFLLAAARADKPTTKADVEKRFGKLAWNW